VDAAGVGDVEARTDVRLGVEVHLEQHLHHLVGGEVERLKGYEPRATATRPALRAVEPAAVAVGRDGPDRRVAGDGEPALAVLAVAREVGSQVADHGLTVPIRVGR
jgi:hypothetical protein